MARESYFVTKTDVTGLDLIDFAGAPAVEQYEALYAALQKHGGLDVAELFAEPIFRREGGEAPIVIAWYAHLPDKARPFTSLDQDEREAVEALLRRKLDKAKEGLKDPETGPLIGSALHVRSPSDVWVLGDRPLIVNWGMLPNDVGRSAAARRSHFAATLGSFLPLGAAPPLSAEELGEMSGTIDDMSEPQLRQAPPDTVLAAGAQDHPETAMSTTSPPSSPPPPTPPPEVLKDAAPRGFRWRWIPLICLLLLTALAIILVSLPGVLIYPPQAVLGTDEIVRITEEGNDALRERRDRLREAIDGAVCRADGEIEFPSVALPPREDGGEEGAAKPDDLLPPRPDRVTVPSEEAEPTNLAQYIEERTAEVLVEYEGGRGIGTGFFIGPDLLVTNDHVVFGDPEEQKELGPPKAIWVKSVSVGKSIRSEVLTSSGQEGFLDFALLRVPGANAPHFQIWGSNESIKLQNVIAAGYGFEALKLDQSASGLWDPESLEIPDMILTQGTVNAQQKLGKQSTLAVLHSANITKGNSGGPLVDQCGRVVGVNTWFYTDETTHRALNLSIHTTELLEFIGKHTGEATTTVEACRPNVEPLPPIARDDTAEPEANGPPPPGSEGTSEPEAEEPPPAGTDE